MQHKFEFEVSDIFKIARRGLVFRGKVKEGRLTAGESVKFISGEVEYSAIVTHIELNRKIVNETVSGPEIGLLLTKFNIQEINDLYINTPDIDELQDYPSPENILKVIYPLKLESC